MLAKYTSLFRRSFFTSSILAAFLASSSYAQDTDDSAQVWNGKRAAVALTYDDSLNVHLDYVKPDLAKYGLKGTFYITVGYEPFPARLEEWQQLAAEGHELGNHTLFHPCDGTLPGREWVGPEQDLSKWSVERMVNDITAANTALQALDGETERTFAYPCGDMKASGTESYVELIKSEFVGARGVQTGFDQLGSVDLFDTRAHMINNSSAEELTSLVDEAIERGALVVFLFHGVGGEHSLNVSRENHQALVKYLDQKKDQVWVAPMVDILRFVKAKQRK